MRSGKKVINLLLLTATCIFSLAYAEEDLQNATIQAGSHTFFRFCSICHGSDGKGNGAYTNKLKVPPPDLTVLAKNNRGQFPWLQLYGVIDGTDPVAGHGSGEMPIWGNQFDLNNWSGKCAEFAPVIVRGRIFELLVYLQSIQKE